MATSSSRVWAFYQGPDVVDVTYGVLTTVGVLTEGRERTELDSGSGMMAMVNRDTLRFVTDELPGITEDTEISTIDADDVTKTWRIRELRKVNSDESEVVLVAA